MISMALAAGYATRMYPLTKDFPKPLLMVQGETILGRLLMDLDRIDAIERHVVVSNHRFIGHFENWLGGLRLSKPVSLIDDGSVDNDNRLGAVRDIQLAVEREGIDDDILVYAADNLLDFSLGALADAFLSDGKSRVMCYREGDPARLRRCGVATIDPDFRVVRMAEKPLEPESDWAVPPFYLYARRDVPLIAEAIRQGAQVDAPGSLVSWLCERTDIRAMKMPGRRVDVGDLPSYERVRMAGI